MGKFFTTDEEIEALIISGLMYELMWEKHPDKFLKCQEEAKDLIAFIPVRTLRKIVAEKVRSQGKLSALEVIRKLNDGSLIEYNLKIDELYKSKYDIVESYMSESKDEQKPIGKRKCPVCSKLITEQEFKDDLSVQEFMISGLCQECQDKTFEGAGNE